MRFMKFGDLIHAHRNLRHTVEWARREHPSPGLEKQLDGYAAFCKMMVWIYATGGIAGAAFFLWLVTTYPNGF